MNWIISRLKEPSTYAGLAAIVGIVAPKLGLDAGTLQTIGVAVASVLAIFMSEKKSA